MALPSISYTGAISSATLSQATDTAGNISCVTTGGAATIIVTFGYTYITAPIVVFSAANNNTKDNINISWVTSTTTAFTIHLGTSNVANTLIWNYHSWETQVSNASSPFAITAGAGANSASGNQCVDIAGQIEFIPNNSAVNDHVFQITHAYSTLIANRVVYSAANEAMAKDLNQFYNALTPFGLINNTLSSSVDTHLLNYHILQDSNTSYYSGGAFDIIGATGRFDLSYVNALYGTDVAGKIIATASGTAAGTVTVRFKNAYSVAPIVVFTIPIPTTSGVWITSTTTDFTIHSDSSSQSIWLDYHVIETQ